MKPHYKLNIDGSHELLTESEASVGTDDRSPPFTQQQLAAAKERVYVNGRTLSQWCAETGLDYQTAGNVLRGHTKATRGEAFRIAAALGLKRQVAKKQSTALSKFPTWDGIERRVANRRASAA